MVDKLIKLTRIGKYKHKNNKGLMVYILPIKTIKAGLANTFVSQLKQVKNDWQVEIYTV